jgi:hypothetical protein
MRTIPSKIEEHPAFKINGFIMLAVVGTLSLGGIWYISTHVQMLAALLGEGVNTVKSIGDPDEVVAGIIATILLVVIPSLTGFFTVEPNQAVVLVLFGKYTGTVRESGFWWTNPFASKQKISLRVRNFNSKIIKVNDADGSPIEIAAVVVWRVFDSAKSKFAVVDTPR